MRKILYIMVCLIGIHILPTEARASQQHKVKEGETLYAIARSYGVSVKRLKEVNNLQGSLIHPADLITIPVTANDKNPAKPSDVNQERGNLTTYIVEKGDSLYRISLKLGLSVAELKEINNLSGNTLQIGQALLVPAGENEEELPDTIETSEEGADGVTTTESETGEDKSVKEEAGQSDNKEPVDNVNNGEDKEAGTEGQKEEMSLIKVARDYIGVPYRFGGETLRGIDCSAFVQRVFRYFSIDLPRTAREQFKAGVKISKKELRMGDLIFFKTYARYPSHVGIYIGEGQMIHASSRRKKVTISSINEPYFVRRYIGAIRLSDAPSRVSLEGNLSLATN